MTVSHYTSKKDYNFHLHYYLSLTPSRPAGHDDGISKKLFQLKWSNWYHRKLTRNVLSQIHIYSRKLFQAGYMLQEWIIKAALWLPPNSFFITENKLQNTIQYIHQLQTNTFYHPLYRLFGSLGTEKQPFYIFRFFSLFIEIFHLYVFNVSDFLIRFGFPGIVNACSEYQKQTLPHQKVYRKSKKMNSTFET